MNYFYLISNFLVLFITIAAIIVAFGWKSQKGKALMCAYLLLTFILSIFSIVLNILILNEKYSILKVANITGSVLGIISSIILLCFVIVASKPSFSNANADTSTNILEDISNISNEQRRSILRRREWTYILDIFLSNIFCFSIGVAIGIAGGTSNDNSESTAFLVGLIISTCYFLFKDSFSGKSLGKLITGLRVVDLDSRQPIGPGKSIARNWIFLVPFLPIVELIVANVREDKRRLGDLMANTIVIKDKMTIAQQKYPTYPTQPLPIPKKDEADDKTPVATLEEEKEQYIYFNCQCGQKIKISSKFAGKVGRCPKCSANIKVPEL